MPDTRLGRPSKREPHTLAQALAEVQPRESHFAAIVTGTDGNLVLFRRRGQTAFAQGYPKLSGVTVTTDDEILVAVLAPGVYVVLGKILS